MRCAIVYQRLFDGTVGGGNWLAAKPVTNVLTKPLGEVARSTNLDAASTVIDRDYGAPVAIDTIMLSGTNLQKDATIQIIASNNPDFSSPLYDSTALPCYPEQWAVGVLPAGHPNAGDRKFTNADIAYFRYAVPHLLPSLISARYWRTKLADPTNTFGYVDVGFLAMGPRYAPGGAKNVGAGETSGFDTTSENSKRAISGTVQVESHAIARTDTVTFPALRLPEAVSVFRLAQHRIGLEGYFVFILDTEAGAMLQHTMYLAQQGTLSELTRVQYNQQTCILAAREVI